MAFDVIDDEERIAMGSSRRRNRSGVNEVRKTFYLLQLTSMINFFLKGASSNITQTFVDGTTVLKGFTLYPESVVLQNDL